MASGGAALSVREPEIGRGHAERLMPLVGEVLAEAGIGYRDLSRIVVAVGPGSFTGLRVGVAAARGLALALGVPAVGVSNLEALAEPFRAAGPVLAALDGKRGEVWLAGFGPGEAEFLAPVAVPLGALPDLLAGLPRFEAVAGSGASIVAAVRPELRVENEAGRVDPVLLARIGLGLAPGEAPRPLYLRGADAKPQRDAALPRRTGETGPPRLP